MTAVGFAQERQGLPTGQQNEIKLPEISITHPQAPINASVSSVEQGYGWLSRHFQRLGPDSQGQTRDSNQYYWFVPTTLNFNQGVAEQRGIGEIFAPMMYWDWFKNVANDTTNLLQISDGEGGSTPITQAYYKQFQGVTLYSIDTIVTFVYKNPNIIPTNAARFIVYSTPSTVDIKTYFNSAGYKQGGFYATPNTLKVEKDIELTTEMLDATVAGTSIAPTVLGFDPPIVLDNKTAAVAMFVADQAPVVNPANIVQGNTEEYEVMPSWWAYRTGHYDQLGTVPGIQPYMTQGTIMLKYQDTNRIYSMGGLTFTLQSNGKQVAAAQDAWIEFFGTAEITSGVKYHFGHDASAQGLGTVTPNPVTSNARLPFSLTEIANVTIDLFDMNGRQVKNLVAAQEWVPGNYSVALPVDELQNGTYMVRMTANGKSYSMKFTVAK
jgi:hypothetical protein